jgi:TolB-like protein
MQYKSGVKRNLRQIGNELGVAHMLEGSVQRSGDRVRVNAQLIDARDDAHLWAQTYDRRAKLFVGVHNKALSVLAMSVNNPDCSPVGIDG